VQSAGETNNRALPAYCVADDKFDDFFRAEGITTLEHKEEFKKKFIEQFELELQSLPKNVHTVVISSEHFHSRIRTEAEMDNVYTLLTAYFDEIKIVCYLREQVTTCTSYYSTHLKSGGIESFGKFLERCKPVNLYYNYFAMLENWERCFGFASLDVSLFAREHFLNGNLLDDFTSKIDPALIGKLNQNIDLENESLTPAGQVLARIVNLVFPVKIELPEVAVIREKCKKLIAVSMTGKGQQPDLETWEEHYNRFIESNEALRQKFFPHVEQLFAVPFEIKSEQNVINDQFSELLISIFHLIKKNKSEVFMPDVYARLWSAVSACVTDVAGVEGVDFSLGPKPVALGDKDAHLLKTAANIIEEQNPQAALRLMTLAAKVKPQFPAIQKKMEEYRRKGIDKLSAPTKLKFILRYHAADDSSKIQSEIQQLNILCTKWLQTLDLPPGAGITIVKGSNTLNSDANYNSDSSSTMLAYTIFHAESSEEAITIAKRCPLLEVGVTLEVSEIEALL
jgi:hypothetical protein